MSDLDPGEKFEMVLQATLAVFALADDEDVGIAVVAYLLEPAAMTVLDGSQLDVEASRRVLRGVWERCPKLREWFAMQEEES